MEEDMQVESEDVVQADEKNDSTTETDAESQKQTKHTRLPMNKVKSIIKMDPEVSIVSADAIFAVTKATEMFIESLAKEAYVFTAKGKRKTVTKKDLDNAIETLDCLFFLEGAMNF